MSEALPTPAAIQKAGREVQEFRKFQQLTCRLRLVEEEVEALRQEIMREIKQFLRVVFRDRRNTGRIDLEAIEMAMRSALHWAGAAALRQLLQFPAPSGAGRTLRLFGAL
jgi:hypothetical protein